MAFAAKAQKSQAIPNASAIPSKFVDSTFEATASLTPELVIALCGPIGSPLHEAAAQIKGRVAFWKGVQVTE